MRKVTGYIGALIIVMALMGSILAGYALNINGQSVVVNEYEKVTDVSGLYSHTDQKTYIDYNPASNYIGYELEQSDTFTINNPNSMGGGLKYKVYTTSHSGYWTDTQYSSGAFYNDGNVVNFSTTGNQIGLTIYRIAFGENFTAYSYMPDGTNPGLEIRTYSDGTLLDRYWPTQVTFNFNGSNVAITFNGNTINSPSSWIVMPANDGDYVVINNGGVGYYQSGQMYTQPEVTPVETPIYEWNGEPTYNFYSVTSSSTPSNYFVPAVFTYEPVNVGMGIDYTESNRVNNYPVGSDTVNWDSISYKTVDLQALSTTNYATANRDWVIGFMNQTIGGHGVVQRIYAPNYDNNGVRQNTIYVYKLSDVLSTVTLPANTREIIIDLGARNITTPISWNLPEVNSGSYTFSAQIKNNFTFINTYNSTYDYPAMNSAAYETGMTYHYLPDTGMVYWYDYNGTAAGSSNVNDTYVQFVSANTSYGKIEYNYDSNPTRIAYYHQDSSRPHPYLNLTIRSSNSLTTPHYMDITKGISIKDTNTTNSIWNNEYENGQIDLLFRAEDSGWTYHNDFTVAGNDISVDYASGRFSVTLNGDTPVDVGTWRSIVLHIDLQNGKLSVRPVRTFNSYSNVILDTASIEIGDLVGAAPTNIIIWKPAAASFTFSVYRTSVFMDTYGIVMVDPTLNITDYFPNLDNFYRLDMYNFTLYGDSITVNGQTGTVTDNTVTFGDDSFILKDFSVIYADGHAYIEDSHVSVDLGVITDNTVSLSGVWYFQTELLSGYTAEKQIYTWDWSAFIFDNVQFCIFYIGLAFAGLVIARHFCIMSITDYAVFIASIIIALGVQVIA